MPQISFIKFEPKRETQHLAENSNNYLEMNKNYITRTLWH